MPRRHLICPASDGNLTRKYFTSNPWVLDQYLAWNILGQLVAVSTSRQGTTTQVTFGYDGLGRRVRKTNVTAGTVTRYIYSGDHVMVEANGAGAAVAAYSYYPGVDAPFAMQRGGSTYVYAREANGNVSGLLNLSGQVAAQYRYGPWGELEYEAASVQNPIRYTGREWDPETGLYFYRARYYDPQVGRFVSEDPIGLAGGINVFAYALNDPVNLRDPSGLNPSQPCPRTSKGFAQAYKGLCDWRGSDDPMMLDDVWVDAWGWADRMRSTAREFSGWVTTYGGAFVRAFGGGIADAQSDAVAEGCSDVAASFLANLGFDLVGGKWLQGVLPHGVRGLRGAEAAGSHWREASRLTYIGKRAEAGAHYAASQMALEYAVRQSNLSVLSGAAAIVRYSGTNVQDLTGDDAGRRIYEGGKLIPVLGTGLSLGEAILACQ